MKVKPLFLITLLIIFGAYSNAGAIPADPFTQNLSTVQFWGLDDPVEDDDGSVTFSIVSFNVPTDFLTEYSKDNSSWNTFSNGTTISISNGEEQLIYLRYGNESSGWDTDGQLTFSGYDRSYNGFDAYNTLVVVWNDVTFIELEIYTPQGGDDIAPIPIPGAVWIFGSGLVGLVGIRRKLKN